MCFNYLTSSIFEVCNIYIYSDGRKLRISPLFPKFLTQNLDYGPNGASVCNLRISPQALSYSFWLRRCSKIRPNFVFSLLWHLFINFPDFPDSARIWFSRCCGTFSSISPSNRNAFQTMFWHVLITRKMKKVPVRAIWCIYTRQIVKISINHQTTETPSKPCFDMF